MKLKSEFKFLGFNPLFIRSVFLLEKIMFFLLSTNRICFNPLFIRSVFLFYAVYRGKELLGVMFQSLIHQVSVSFSQGILNFLWGLHCFNPLFIRSVFLFGSEKKKP